MVDGKKTTAEYWEEVYTIQPRLRIPSRLFVGVNDLIRLLGRDISTGTRVLEIGCAPGKILTYLAKVYNADVSGIDYSPKGINFARRLFEVLGINGDLRCEDIFNTSFPAGSFDFVYSVGVIEHFEDPRKIVKCHIDLVRRGGTVLISVPNYNGLYGKLQRYFDQSNLDIHNLAIMSPRALLRLVPGDIPLKAEAFRFGRVNPWLINVNRKWPATTTKLFNYVFNFLGLLQPFDIRPLCPTVVLKITKM